MATPTEIRTASRWWHASTLPVTDGFLGAIRDASGRIVWSSLRPVYVNPEHARWNAALVLHDVQTGAADISACLS